MIVGGVGRGLGGRHVTVKRGARCAAEESGGIVWRRDPPPQTNPGPKFLMQPFRLACLALLLTSFRLGANDYPVQPVPFTAVRLTGGFWQQKQEVNRTVTLPFALKQCEDSGRLRNFDLAAETLRRRAAGERSFQNRPVTEFPFDDTDVYKEIEGASYVLSMAPDTALAALTCLR